MTKKHFVDIAQTLSEAKPDIADDRDWYLKNSVSRVRAEKGQCIPTRLVQEDLIRRAFEIRLMDWTQLCLQMGVMLKAHNGRFEMQRFLSACGMHRDNESQEVK